MWNQYIDSSFTSLWRNLDLSTHTLITTSNLYKVGDVLLMFTLAPWASKMTCCSISGYSGSLALRLLAGEHTLGFPATIPWPWYDAEINLQVSPHRTVAMLIGASLTLLVSYITHRLFTENIVDAKYDRWTAVVNVSKNNHNKRRVDSENDPEPRVHTMIW